MLKNIYFRISAKSMRINNHPMPANPSMAVTQAFIYKPGFNLLDFRLQKETTLIFVD
jgi:hypothetical protein